MAEGVRSICGLDCKIFLLIKKIINKGAFCRGRALFLPRNIKFLIPLWCRKRRGEGGRVIRNKGGEDQTAEHSRKRLEKIGAPPGEGLYFF